LPQSKLTGFDARMGVFRQQLLDAARELSSQYDQIKSEARRRLGSLFNPADYPTTLDGMFDLEVSYPPIEPPHYLEALNPGVFEAEQARVRERFESAVELAEQAFATELQKLVPHLAERLPRLQDGQPRVFRDSCITNFTECFERFRRLNVRSNPELDSLVDQARQVITGIEPQQLRDSVRLRAMVANDFTRIEQAVGDPLVDRPRRNILRRAGAGSGGAA
jgi:hypothetical protein